jgi:hypothetical protein
MESMRFKVPFRQSHAFDGLLLHVIGLAELQLYFESCRRRHTTNVPREGRNIHFSSWQIGFPLFLNGTPAGSTSRVE